MTSWMVLLDAIYRGNVTVAAIGLVCVGVTIYMIRNQTFISDCQFVKGMIPHHSMAVRMAREIKNKTKDHKIAILADDIIKSQNSEISLMKSWGY